MTGYTSKSRYIVNFSDEHATISEIVGGKGANLGLLSRAGLDVPPGFTVSVDSYRAFIETNGLTALIQQILGRIDFGNADGLETLTAEIRAAIEAAPMPDDLAQEIREAYATLGHDKVAVRSSGTAEDMSGASFAGLHDTYLEISGADAVVEKVKSCWASMWSARATSYRRTLGFDQGTIGMAVVVQAMISAEVSGVMFTANPLAVRTDQFVINASWGLGEAIVSGLVNPDQYVLSASTFAVTERILGAKEIRITRAAAPATGTITSIVPESERQQFCMTDADLARLAAIGRDVMQRYEGLPQDIEWAYLNGNFYVLQARPVTGAEFMWEECLEDAAQNAEEDVNTTWTQRWAEMYWTGGVTPLFYSVRGRNYRKGPQYMADLAGLPELKKMWYFRWHKGTVYYNADFHKAFLEAVLPKWARGGMIDILPDSWVEESAATSLDIIKYLRSFISINSSWRCGILTWIPSSRDWVDNRVAEANGLSNEQLQELSDASLREYARKMERMQEEFSEALWVGPNIAMPHIFGLLNLIVQKYYKGENKLIFQDLISGIPDQSLQSIEMHELFKLAQMIRNTPSLRHAFDTHPGAAFFDAARELPDGAAFVAAYGKFVEVHGHRGHADRDVFYTRRAEDPNLDYAAFQSLLSNPNPTPPGEVEARVIERREKATAELISHLERHPLGSLLVSGMRFLQNEALSSLRMRDDWRHYADRITFSKRKAFLEAGRRGVERGVLDEVYDIFFLTDIELFEALAGKASRALLRAKIENRRKAHSKVENREATLPLYFKGRKPVDLGAEAVDNEGAIVGLGMSGGVAEGRARVIPSLKDIGKVEQGDILICNATDPGWASVFTLIKGLVIETGGMLAHGACLSREHGIPAVQIRNAMQVIPDGARVQIRGESGEIVVLQEFATAAE